MQWRSWPAPDGHTIDQIAQVLEQIRSNPTSRRLIVSAWNVGELENMRLPPCHLLFQFYVAGGRLSCQMYQRSADVFLGVPFNIASYALLTMMVAQVCDLEPGELVHTLGDAHLYRNHLDQARLQLTRDPRPLPKMRINPEVRTIDGFRYEDFELVGYDPHPHIRAEVVGMRVSIIVAMSSNGVIGRDGQLPWHLSADLRRFKRLTMGHHLLVGRRTWDSIGRPLPGRTMLVLTRDPEWRADGATRVGDLDEALGLARAAGDDELFIGGGAAVYRLALERADRLYLTEVLAEVEGDTHFPSWDRSAWREVESEEHQPDEKNLLPHRFVVYEHAG